MAHKYSRTEKGKATSSRDNKRAPVRLPPSENSNLIEENKLTLIGRVTNPAVQKIQWVVDWLIQYWNVEGELTGRELGPDLSRSASPQKKPCKRFSGKDHITISGG